MEQSLSMSPVHSIDLVFNIPRKISTTVLHEPLNATIASRKNKSQKNIIYFPSIAVDGEKND